MLFAETHKIINTFIDNLQQNVYFSNIDTPKCNQLTKITLKTH